MSKRKLAGIIIGSVVAIVVIVAVRTQMEPPAEDLTGLEYLINVTWLALQNNQVSDISVLASLTSLKELELGSNQIRDISPLTGLANLTWLDLSYNQISDSSPLVDNTGLGEGDEVDLQNNPLSSDSINIYIPQLQARGVDVNY